MDEPAQARRTRRTRSVKPSRREAPRRLSQPRLRDQDDIIAYHLGTAALMKIALDRVRDPVHPSDSILIHLLAVREVDQSESESTARRQN
jgi:hypothetical protein